MRFFEHTSNWIRGEIFEGQMLIVWGIALIVVSLFFWKAGFSPTTRALILPFMIVGVLAAGTGGGIIVSNKNHVETLRAAYDKGEEPFIKSEESRVADFSKWYRYLLMLWSGLVISGVIVFMAVGGDRGRAIAVGLILLGLSGFLIDHTSEQNARDYASKIRDAIEKVGP